MTKKEFYYFLHKKCIELGFDDIIKYQVYSLGYYSIIISSEYNNNIKIDFINNLKDYESEIEPNDFIRFSLFISLDDVLNGFSFKRINFYFSKIKEYENYNVYLRNKKIKKILINK